MDSDCDFELCDFCDYFDEEEAVGLEELQAYLDGKGDFPLHNLGIDFNPSEQAEIQIIHKCFWLANWKGSKLKMLPPCFAGSALELWALIHMFVSEKMEVFIMEVRRVYSGSTCNNNDKSIYNSLEVLRELLSIRDNDDSQPKQMPIMTGILDRICRHRVLPACDQKLIRKVCWCGGNRNIYKQFAVYMSPLMEIYGHFPKSSPHLKHARMTEIEWYAVDLVYRVIAWTQYISHDPFILPLPSGTDMETSLMLDMINCEVYPPFTFSIPTQYYTTAKALTHMHSAQMNISYHILLNHLKSSFINTSLNVSEAGHLHVSDQRRKMREFSKASLKNTRNSSPAKVLLPELMSRIAEHLSRSRYSDNKLELPHINANFYTICTSLRIQGKADGY
jgi:hypothetical protein